MNKDIRDMIDKVNNFKQIINENSININTINEIPRGETHYDRINPEYYNSLRNDIRKNGIKEPLVFYYYYKDNAMELKEGHHRLKIANELGIDNVPIKIIVNWDRNIEDGKVIYHPPKKLDIDNYVRRNYYPTFIDPSELGFN